jgi:hypothetical protein
VLGKFIASIPGVNFFEILELPDLREILIDFSYATDKIAFETWERLSFNCPKLTHIYHTSLDNEGAVRKIVAKRACASGLIRKMRSKNSHQRIEGDTRSNRWEFDSSDGEEDTEFAGLQ